MVLSCEIDEAESVAAALAAIGRRLPDVIVLDLTMPIRGGMSMLEELQENSRTRAIPIVVRTGKELDAAEEEALERYRIPVVFKQDEAFVLAERVSMVLERSAVAVTERQNLSHRRGPPNPMGFASGNRWDPQWMMPFRRNVTDLRELRPLRASLNAWLTAAGVAESSRTISSSRRTRRLRTRFSTPAPRILCSCRRKRMNVAS